MSTLSLDGYIHRRDYLRLADGVWQSGDTFPTVTSDIILAEVKHGQKKIGGADIVYSLLQVRNSVIYRMYVDVTTQIPTELPLTYDDTIISWKSGVAAFPGYGLSATYFDNTVLSGTPLFTTHSNIDFSYSTTNPIFSGGPYDQFSARWEGWVKIPETGDYTFRTVSDDGVRLWVDDVLVIDNWSPHLPVVNKTHVQTFVAGYSKIKLEYYQAYDSGVIQLMWATPFTASLFQVIPATYLYDPGEIS